MLHHHYTLEIRVHPAWLDVSANGNVGIVTGARVGVNTMESPVEEIIETLVNGICLAHYDRVSLGSRVADGSNCVHLVEIITS